MSEKVYFSKVEFREYIGYALNSILLLDLVEGTLACQVYKAEKHIWPSEKLYRYVVKTFLNHKKLKNWVVPYSGLSLFI